MLVELLTENESQLCQIISSSFSLIIIIEAPMRIIHGDLQRSANSITRYSNAHRVRIAVLVNRTLSNYSSNKK